MEKPKLGGHISDIRQTNEKTYDLFSTKLTTLDNNSNEYDLRNWCSPIEYQSRIGSCVANATVGALEFLQIKNNIPFTDLSRMFLYYNARLMHRSQEVDEGTYINLAFNTLASLGTCTEKSWPYIISKVFVRPTWASYREAYPNKIKGYYRLSDDIDNRHEQIKHALACGYPIVFGTKVDDDFVYKTASDGIIALPQSKRTGVGGHAMMICGLTSTNLLIVRNSWGINWGDNGYCYISPDYLKATNADDFWVPSLTVNI